LEEAMKKLSILLVLAVILVPAMISADSVITPPAFPRLINYQGMVTDAGGNPLNGQYMMIFSIYDDTTGAGSVLWVDSVYVTISQGLFNVMLGSGTALNLTFDKSYWLEVKVDYQTMPRVRLTSAGYAYRASIADSAVVAGSGGGGGGGWVDDGAVVRLESPGDTVGIGTASPAAKLDVNGGMKVTGRITSTVSTGTAPLELSSSTKNDSLNADMVDGLHAGSFTQIRAEGTVTHGNSTALVIPHYVLWTLQLACGHPQTGGVCFVQGFENDRYIAVTYIKYDGDGGGGQVGGAEGYEGNTTTLVSFGSGLSIYSVKCPGESIDDHNIVLDASGSTTLELRYRLIY
jgi:hypothetical protein